MTITFKKDKVNVEQFKTRVTMGQKAAKDAVEAILDVLARKPKACLMFAAAPSQSEFLSALSEDKRIDWSRISVMQLDEYLNFDPSAPQSFAQFLRRNIFDKVAPGEFFFIQSDCDDPEEERQRYIKILKDNPPDIAFIGIGENGHLAFNDPNECDFNDPELARVITLSLKSREQQVNDGCFATLNEVPKIALTVTIPAILGAKKILCIVPAKSKAHAIYETLNSDIGEHVPATVLRTHPNATIYLDADSASLLKAK